jgi:hypothetical protein
MIKPSELKVPVKVNVCPPAVAVSITFCPSIVPDMGALPLLQGGNITLGAGAEVEGGTAIE